MLEDVIGGLFGSGPFTSTMPRFGGIGYVVVVVDVVC